MKSFHAALIRRALLTAAMLALVVTVMLAILAGATLARAQALDPAGRAADAVRDVRYCEILAVRRRSAGPVATVYNTLGLNGCPADRWSALTARTVTRQLGLVAAVMNGPRHFVMDRIASDAAQPGDVVEIGGVALRRQAEIALRPGQRSAPPYAENHIDRATTYVFSAGKPIFVLTSPNGARYVMQSYAQIVDPKLAYADLPNLESRLKLPKGWHYGVETPQSDLVLKAASGATVVQDDLKNTYQRM